MPTRKELAADVGVSRQTLNDYIRQGCPADSPEAVKSWRESNKRPRPGAKPANGESMQARLLRAQTEKVEQEARMAKLKADKLANELVEKSEIIREFAEWLTAARPILDSLPDDIATETPGELRAKVHAIAKSCVNRTLTKLATWQPSVIDPDEDTDA